MSTDLRELFEAAGRSAPPPVRDVDTLVHRARRRHRRRVWTTGVGVAVTCAAVVAVLISVGVQRSALPDRDVVPTSPSPTVTARPAPTGPPPTRLVQRHIGGSFSSIAGAAVGPDGTVYVSDDGQGSATTKVVRISASGVTTTVFQRARGASGLGDLAVGPSGEVFVLDGLAILEIGPDHRATHFVGGPGQPWTGSTPVDGPASVARFTGISQMVAAASGDLYVVDGGVPRKVSREGTVTPVPGPDPSTVLVVGGQTAWGDAHTISVAPDGTIYVGSDDNSIRVVSPAGRVTGLADTTQFHRMHVAYDPVSRVLLVDSTSGLESVDTSGNVRSIALTPPVGDSAPLFGIAVGPEGTILGWTDHDLYVLDRSR